MITVISKRGTYTINTYNEIASLIVKHVANVKSITETIKSRIYLLLQEDKNVYSCFLGKLARGLYKDCSSTIHKKEYWIIRGYSSLEADDIIKHNQKKNSYKLTKQYYIDNNIDTTHLAKKQARDKNHFIEKYGEVDGMRLYKEFCQKSKITLERLTEIYGEVEAKERYEEYIRKQKSAHEYNVMVGKHGVEGVNRIMKSRMHTGSKNGMFGKPSPINSGRGMCGYYNGNYFRSSLEYYYMKQLERESKEYICNDTAEKDNPLKVVIPIRDGRNYIPDFIVGNVIVEVKAKWRLNAEDVVEKKKVAEEWCLKNGYTYHIITEDDIDINKNIMDEDVRNGILVIKRNIQMRKKQ